MPFWGGIPLFLWLFHSKLNFSLCGCTYVTEEICAYTQMRDIEYVELISCIRGTISFPCYEEKYFFKKLCVCKILFQKWLELHRYYQDIPHLIICEQGWTYRNVCAKMFVPFASNQAPSRVETNWLWFKSFSSKQALGMKISTKGIGQGKII